MKKSTLQLILKFIGISLFIFIIYTVNLERIINVLKNANILLFLLGIFISLPSQYVKAVRWNLFMRKLNINYSFFSSFYIYQIGVFYSILMPGRVGDFLRINHLKSDGHNITDSFFSIFLDKLFDLCFLISFGYLGLFLFFKLFKIHIIIITIILIVTIVFILILYILRKKIELILFKCLSLFLEAETIEKSKKNVKKSLINLKKVDALDYIAATATTILSWLLYFVGSYLLALSLGINLSFVYITLCVAISILITLIPITFSGVGTREATLLMLFSLVNVNKETTIAFSLLLLANLLIMAIIGFIFWLIKPFFIKNINKTSILKI